MDFLASFAFFAVQFVLYHARKSALLAGMGCSKILGRGRFMAKEAKKGKIGEKVEVSGNYVCDNCGHYQYFEKGDDFEDCQSCFETEIGWELD